MRPGAGTATRRTKLFLILVVLGVLLLAGWYAWRTHVHRQQEAQLNGYALPLDASRHVQGYALPDVVTVSYVEYGDVAYARQACRYTPLLPPGADAVRICGYEPKRRPWLADRSDRTGRIPSIEVRETIFRDTAAALVTEAGVPGPGFELKHQDPRGVSYYERNPAAKMNSNIMAILRVDTAVYTFDTFDDRVGLQAVVNAGFRYDF